MSTLTNAARRNKIQEHWRRIFRREKFHALYVAGHTEAIYRYPGDNMGSIAVKIGMTGALQDTISDVMDGASPYCVSRVFFRLWFQNRATAKQISDYLRARHLGFSDITLRKSWLHMVPDQWDSAMFELEIRKIAEDLDLECWTDEGLEGHIAGLLFKEMRRKAG